MVPVVQADEGTPPSTPVPEILGGQPATPGEWPWQVALVFSYASESDLYNGQFCGGSLIYPQWVVTAAHCITDDFGGVRDPSFLDVVAGIYDLSTPAPGYQRRDVIQIIRHPSYSNIDNDIALLKLASPITIGGSGDTATANVPLVPPGIGTLAGRLVSVTGWGNAAASQPTTLHEVEVPVITNTLCNDANHYDGWITANMLCAGYDDAGACQLDAGGPLVVYDAGVWKLAGVSIGFGFGCYGGAEGIYTRVSQFISWVNQNVNVVAAPFSPSGAVGTNYFPMYTWNAAPTMTQYYLYVYGPNGAVIHTWYNAADINCEGGGSCRVRPNVPLVGGTYTWWVRAYTPSVYGPWSAGMTFSTAAQSLPGSSAGIAPTASSTNATPTFSWTEIPAATRYRLVVRTASGVVFKKWFTSVDASCSGGTCSVSPGQGFPAGTYTWRVRTANEAGFGPWSSALSFTVLRPPAPTLVAPTGGMTLGTATPTYTWNETPGATWYFLYVSGPSGVIKRWVQASTACSGGTCSATPNVGLWAFVDYQWRVRAYSPAGFGPWSGYGDFNTNGAT
jgi:hypothetical protein